MKRFLTLICIFLIIFLASCSNDIQNTNDNNKGDDIKPNDNIQKQEYELAAPSFHYWGKDTRHDMSGIVSIYADKTFEIYYTTDGTEPTTDSYKYEPQSLFYSSSRFVKSISVNAGKTIRAFAYKAGKRSETIAFKVPETLKVEAPTFVKIGNLPNSNSAVIQIRTNDPDATILFSFGKNSEPTKDGLEYSKQSYSQTCENNLISTGISATFGTTIKAYAISKRYNQVTEIIQYQVAGR